MQVLELRSIAAQILATRAPADKVAGCAALREQIERGQVTLDAQQVFDKIVVGRPDAPELVSPLDVPRRKTTTLQGRLGMVHALAHIEFNAINLALDALVRFAGLPEAYYWDWWHVAFEESTHFSMLQAHLQKHGSEYGAFTAHNGLWDMAERTRHHLTDRMAMVPRTLEARGLDACPMMRDKLLAAGDSDAAAIIDIILRDEIGHVALGNKWFIYACERDNVAPVLTYKRLKTEHGAPSLRPPFNLAARREAGFFAEELLELQELS
ncbi:MAG: ferritin-like domain-containing protein [Formosimonas sp.]